MASWKVFRFQRAEDQQRSLRALGSIGLTIALSLVLTLASGELSSAMAAPSDYDDEIVDVVFDSAELFSEDEEFELNLMAMDFLDAYGVAMAVETVDSIGGASIEQWTKSRAGERRVGSSELDNGLFYGIAVDDRDFYVAKGNGFASIPDFELQSILDEEMIPRFREGDYLTGVVNSADRFGALAIGEPLEDEAGESASTAEGYRERAGFLTVFGWIFGALGLVIAAVGGLSLTSKLRERSRTARADALELEELERKRLAQLRRTDALSTLSAQDWKNFAELSGGKLRQKMLLERGVYAQAFDLPAGELPSQSQLNLLDEDISREQFGGAPFHGGHSVREARKEHAKRQEQLRRQRTEEAEERRREEGIRRQAKNFWSGLSSREREEYGKLHSDSERQRWISSHGGGSVFGLNPIVAFAVFSSLSSESAAAASRSSSSSSTDYRSSSSTDYGSSNMFGGGSFDSGGGAGGSW